MCVHMCVAQARALAHYGAMGLCPEFSKHRWDYYVWLDFAGINQDDYHEKLLGLAMCVMRL